MSEKQTRSRAARALARKRWAKPDASQKQAEHTGRRMRALTEDERKAIGARLALARQIKRGLLESND